MIETKTGALVCKMPDPENNFAYKPLVFITDIPANYTDEDLKANFDLAVLGEIAGACAEILFRADIHSTSNEVQEEFEMLHPDSSEVPRFSFVQKHISV